MKKILVAAMLLAASTSFAAGELIISFVMDGDLSGGTPKVVELKNVGDAAVDLQDYKLALETNANTTYGTTLTWSSQVLIPAGSSYVIASEATASAAVIGYAPDEVAAVYINGDDRVALLAASDDSLLDLVGELGVDGTGAAWEYTDSYMFRSASVTAGNPTWTASEWTVGGVAALDTLDEATHNAMFNSDTGTTYKITTLNGAAPPAATEVADIATGLAEADDTEIQITGTVTVISATNGLNTGRNQFFVQDATGGLYIDDSAYKMGADVAIGDTLTDLTVVLGTYSGMRQGVPSGAPTIGSGSAPAPAVLTGSEALADIVGTLVRINGVSITTLDSTFDSGSNGFSYDLDSAVGDISVIRLEEGSALVGEAVPSGTFDIIGVCGQYNSTGQILPRLASDVITSSVSDWTLF